MDLGIKNKVALVTGSSQGMGRAIAAGFASEGARVVMCARDQKRLEKAAQEIRSVTKATVLPIKADVEDPDQIKSLISKAVSEFGTIDILVCNSGGPPAKLFTHVSDQEWERYFNLNLRSYIRLSQEVIPLMKAQRWGRILFLSSVSVKQPISNLVISNVIRSGVVGLTKSLSNELAPYNILVNNVCPGYVRTERVLELAEAEAKQNGVSVNEILERYGKNNPIGRIGEPEEIANVFLFLASEKASYLTGVSLHVDGGFVKGVF